MKPWRWQWVCTPLARVMPASVRRRLADVRQTVPLDLARPMAAGNTAVLLDLSAAARTAACALALPRCRRERHAA